MTKIFQTFGTWWYFESGDTPLVTTAFVVVPEPAAVDFFLLSFLPSKNAMARIMPRIHRATKAQNINLRVDEPKIIKIRYYHFFRRKPCDDNDSILIWWDLS